MKANFLKLLMALPLLFAACTDLEEGFPPSEVEPERVPDRVRDVYTTLRGNAASGSKPDTYPWFLYVYAIQTSTDEIMIPRQDANAWYDAGIYQDMQKHTWRAENIIFNSAWEYLYNIVANCNYLLIRKESFSYGDRAQLQTLRAYAYFRLMDLFGDVPLKTEYNYGDLQFPARTPRAELFAWLENQLTYIEGTEESVEEHLQGRTFPNYGTMTKGAYNVLKARLFLNSKVFLGLTDDDPQYQAYLEKVVSACDNVIESRDYQLESNVFANWFSNNGARSREIIFAIPYLGDGSGEGNELPITTLMPSVSQVFRGSHYNGATSGWQVNPGRTADDPNALFGAERADGYFGIFHKNDNRRLAILTGQLYNRDRYVQTGAFEKLTFGNWYVRFDPPNSTNIAEIDPLSPYGTTNATHSRPDRQTVFANLAPWFEDRGFNISTSAINENSYKAFGARIIKFELEENPTYWDSPVDMVVMRYAEVLYSKAEALIRLGRSADAIPLFREVLANRGFDPMDDSGYNQDYPFRDMDTDMYGKDKPSNAPDGLKISAVALMSKEWLTGRTTDLTAYMPIEPTLEFMDKEWRREFAFEDRRRADMIRMGKFAGPNAVAWGMHEATTDPNKNLFPIPQAVRNAHPAVSQNPGY